MLLDLASPGHDIGEINVQTRIIRSACVATGLLFGMSAVVFAAERTHNIEPEDYFSVVAVMDCAFSPDGARIAYTQVDWGGPRKNVPPSCGSSTATRRNVPA
jgi:hypothetical protein